MNPSTSCNPSEGHGCALFAFIYERCVKDDSMSDSWKVSNPDEGNELRGNAGEHLNISIV